MLQQGCYEIKKVLPVDNNLSLEECEKLLVSENISLGILDENREIISYVLKEDLNRALNFNINHYPINLIETLADLIDIKIEDLNETEVKKYAALGLNRGFFIGKNKKEIRNLIIYKNSCMDYEEKFLLNEYEKNMTDKAKKALELCSQAADKISLPIFLIGGIVRDIIIGKKSIDIDITVEENAIEFSRYLRKEYPKIVKIKEIHDEFKTTKVILTIDNEKIELDIASTRKERYQYPASLPTVNQIGCNIKDDILRRDFTINSMALSLNKASFCKLIDPLDGYKDLKEKKIKILHPLSFIDDPTRIIRALKFSTRFNCEIEKNTKQLEKNCINSGLFNNLGGERIKSEIKQTFNLNKTKALTNFIENKTYLLIDKDIEISKDFENLSKKCQKTISKYKKFIGLKELTWLIYLGTLLINSSKDEINKIANKLYLSGLETEILLGSRNILNKLESIKKIQTRFELYEELENYFAESILISLVGIEDKEITEKIDLYLNQLQNIKINITGKELIEMGLTPGPIFGEVLRELLQAKINQEIDTPEQEREYIKKYIPQKDKKKNI